MTQTCLTPAKPTVLVVDDSPEYLGLAGSALAATCTVRVAGSGQRALQLAAQDPIPDLVLLDELRRTRDELYERNRKLQEEVERRDALQVALQETVAELEAFNYSVSHDLRAPLSAIGAFAESVHELEGGRLSEQGRHRLGRVVEGSRRMSAMIDDILACSRVDQSAMQCSPVDLNLLAAEVVDELGCMYPAACVAVGPLPTVRADAAMLRQVLSNLVGNALKFSSRSVAARVEISANNADGADEIVVRDNGAGFDPACADKLFGLFQRLHSEQEFPGTGVGLAIVKRLVARHRGHVRAESVPGGWTTFAFTLPGAGPAHNLCA